MNKLYILIACIFDKLWNASMMQCVHNHVHACNYLYVNAAMYSNHESIVRGREQMGIHMTHCWLSTQPY